MRRSPTVVLVVNASEVTDGLADTLRTEGLHSIATPLADIRKGEADLPAILAQHEPCAVIWDVALPYYGNWQYLQALRRAGIFGALPVVVTTPNRASLDRIIGENTGAIEVDGESSDLQRVLAKLCATAEMA